MTRNKGSVAARFDPDPQHLLLSRIEFDRLCEVAQVPEKENTLFLLGLAVPCGINAYAAFPVNGDLPSTAFILNFIVVVIAGLLAFFQARNWRSKRKIYSKYIQDLDERPQGRLQFSMTNDQGYVNTPGSPASS